MLVKFAGAKWTICRRQRRAKALGGSQPAWGGQHDLPSGDPERLKGRDVADFGLGIGGSAATQPKKHRRTQRQDDWGLPRSFRNYWRAGIFAPTQPESW